MALALGRAAWLALGLLVFALGASAEGAPAAGGAPLLRGAEAAPVTLVGVVRDRRQLDVQGYVSTLEIERVIAGIPPAKRNLRIGWEELARHRPPRFSVGDRVVVALVPLPDLSLWRQRFPRGEALAVAEAGAAFLRDPDPETLSQLEHFLALPREERSRNAGALQLAKMVAGAAAPIAAAALAQLDQIPDLEARLGELGQAALAGVLGSAASPLELERELLGLAKNHMLRGLRTQVAVAARPGGALEAPALISLGALDGGLPGERIASLLARPEPEVRIAALTLARGTSSEARVAELIASDPNPAVRSAAVESWVQWKQQAAFGAAEPALFDADRSVRGRAAKALGSLGPPAVPRLVALLEGRSAEQSIGPLTGLYFAGKEGAGALKRIAAEHPDPKVRKIALIALGKPLKRH